MNQIYLINRSAFDRYQDISINIKPERLQTFIKKAQDLDLKLFFGSPLYYSLLRQFDMDSKLNEDAPQHYKDLLNGTEYLDEKGHIVLYEGLAPALVYLTFARFIESDAIQYTTTGPVIKQHDGAQPLPAAETAKLVQQQRSIANAYLNDVERFLWDHQQLFPLWQLNNRYRTARQSGPRIRGIDKTAFNTTAISGTTLNYPLITEFLN